MILMSKPKKRLEHHAAVELEIKAYDKEGRLIATRRKKSDLMVIGFRKLICMACIKSTRSALYDVTATDEGGTSRTFRIGSSVSIFVGASATQSKIAIGTGTTAPADGNTALQTKRYESDAVTFTELSNGISCGATISCPTGYDITESGYFGSYLDTGTYARVVLLARDTFAPITVPPGGSLSVTYKFLHA